MNHLTKRLRQIDVTFSVICEVEETPIACRVPPKDRPYVQKRLDDGKIWAWCRVKVVAAWADLNGVGKLECCSFMSEDDFKSDRHYNRLKEQALRELNIKVAETFEAVEFKI